MVPAGSFFVGSDRRERELAYRLDAAGYGHSLTRRQGWYEGEGDKRRESLPAFAIMATPVTNRDYARFIAQTGHPAPAVDAVTWNSYGLIHPYARTRRFAWRNRHPPAGRADHPVVLVSQADAQAFARWLSRKTGQRWRLPSALEWEKAVRGPDGRIFPWGNSWDPGRLNSSDQGPFDTQPVGRYPGGAGPHGLLDGAGQVYEWTASAQRNGRVVVKGGAWDDKGCGVCRPAAGHGRPAAIKHILIGFRLLRELNG